MATNTEYGQITISGKMMESLGGAPFDSTDLTSWKNSFRESLAPIEIQVPVFDDATAKAQSPVSGFGKMITLGAAKRMIFDGKLSEMAKLLYPEESLETTQDYVLAVTFSKQSLLLLLSQPFCEGIKCYFCKNHLGRDSLVLIGVDKDENDLIGVDGDNRQKSLAHHLVDADAMLNEAIIFEVGGPYLIKNLLPPKTDCANSSDMDSKQQSY